MSSAMLLFCLLCLVRLNYSQFNPINITITSLPTTFPTVLASLTTAPTIFPTVLASLTTAPNISPTEQILPSIDIGCNYVNLGGFAAPVDYCMHVEPRDPPPDHNGPPGHDQTKIVHIKFNCNAAYDGINIEVYPDPECGKRAFFTANFPDAIDFGCNKDYKFKKCDEVSLKGYPNDQCDGDIFEEFRLITEACIPGNNNTFTMVECTETTITILTYINIPIQQYGTCDDKYKVSTFNIQHHSANLDGQKAGCVAVEGCGDYASEHQVIDIGCNYVNFNGFAMPMDQCMFANTEKINYSYKVYCDKTWNKLMFGYWSFNAACNGIPLKEADLSADFQYVCKKEYVDVSCDTMELRGYLDNSCAGSQYYDLVFITDVCLYDDTDIYCKVNCHSDIGSLSMYQTIDAECIDNNLVNTKLMSEEIEIWDIVFFCSQVNSCPVSDITTSVPKQEKKVDDGKAKRLTMMVIVSVGSVAGLCILVIILFSLHRFCKQKKEIQIMDQTHSGRRVKNPYGHVDSIADKQIDSIADTQVDDGNVNETDDTLLNA